MRRLPRSPTAPGVLLLLGTLAVSPLSAQGGPGFRFGFGSSHLAGDVGEAFDGAVDAEFSILVPVFGIRVGGGANWASFAVTDDASSFSRIRFHALVGVPFRVTANLRPYAEARYTFQRFRPEDDRYFGGEDRILRDFVASGSGAEGVVGVEVGLGERVALDLSGAVGTFGLSPDLDTEGLGPVDAGTTWRLHAGVSWFPVHGRRGEAAR